MFAKLFATKHGQLLLTKEDDDEEGRPQIIIRGEAQHSTAAQFRLTFDTEAARDIAFDAADQASAEKSAGQMFQLLAGFPVAAPAEGSPSC